MVQLRTATFVLLTFQLALLITHSAVVAGLSVRQQRSEGRPVVFAADDAVEEGQQSGPSRADIVRAWLRAMLTRAVAARDQDSTAPAEVILKDNLPSSEQTRTRRDSWNMLTRDGFQPEQQQSAFPGAPASSKYPIVFRKRNLCCSLDLYCANCDDQRRKRTV
jgi:hypothetical protein